MILSYHPCYIGDVNRLCAGREPDDRDRSAIRAADAVVLPQGCRESLYQMARKNCPHLFPNYDARFRYPGKTGQARLFQALDAPHPRTWIFDEMRDFQRDAAAVADAGFPLVFKLDWGGEGLTVRLLRAWPDLERALSIAEAYERSGHRGFVLQSLVPSLNRTLRVAVIGQTQRAYWRVQDNSLTFGTSVAGGARIDTDSDPEHRHTGMELVRGFCRSSGINLGGFDIIFEETDRFKGDPRPLMLEINYFFGRTGLGGSERFYELLRAEIDRWMTGLGSTTQPPFTTMAERETP